MHGFRVRATLLAGLLLGSAHLSGCYEELPKTDAEEFFVQMAEASCAWEFENCNTPNYSSMESCVTVVEEELRDRHEQNAEDGRTYDGTCARRVLQTAQGEGVDECDAGCTIYPGDKEAGEACTPDDSGSDCVQGLACSDRMICVRYVDFFAIQPGETCRDVQGSLGTCAEGYACSGGDTCVTAPAVGETCLAGASGTPAVCDKSDYCEPMMRLCQPKKEDGFQCEADTECLSETCLMGTCGITTVCTPPDATGTCF